MISNFLAVPLCLLSLAASIILAGAGILTGAPAANALDTRGAAEWTLSKLVNDSEPVQLEAFRLLESGKDDAANKLLTARLKDEDVTSGEEVAIHYLLALIDRKNDKMRNAIKHLKAVEEKLGESKKSDLKDQAVLSRRMADCYYDMREIEDAKSYYEAALMSARFLKDDSDPTVETLDSMVGCHLYKREYKEAIRKLESLERILRRKIGSGNIQYMVAYFWNQLQMAQVYRRTGAEEKAKAMRPAMLEQLGQFIVMRSKLENEGKLKTLQDRILLDYLLRNKPESIADCLYLSFDSRHKIKSLPLIAWRDEQRPLKGTILCIHGMGLENRAFTFFGREMARRGYLVCALDVRGFGAWLSSPGEEEIMFSDTIKDIGFLVELLESRHPEVPIFVLGESMGGAIALRSIAELGDIADGVIASVPSAEVFQQRKMALQVAFHFLKSPSRPYEALDDIANQASTRPALVSTWTDDPKAKSKASPKEMIKFSIFMRQTERACKKIKDTPAFLVQGLKDALVKPKGTFKMFELMPCPDKDMFIIGQAEHLIIETEQQSMLFLDALTSWLEQHSVKRHRNKSVAD